MQEVWKDIKGFEGLYQVSNLGKVKRLERKTENKSVYGSNKYAIIKERAVKTYKHKNGYERVQIYKNKKRYIFSIHRLVAEAFIDNPNNCPNVLHKIALSNGGSNEATNLYWGTQLDNAKDRKKDGHDRGRTVLQFNLKNEFIKEWKSIKEASEKTKTCYHNIHQCCNNDKPLNNSRRTANGFIWKYKEEVI